MKKCTACQENLCGGDFENRDKCIDPDNCSCRCQETGNTTVWKGLLSVTAGVAAVGGGVFLTVATGGVAAIMAGGLLTGAGSSAVLKPITTKMSGERMTGKDYLSDVAISSVVGIASGGIGAGLLLPKKKRKYFFPSFGPSQSGSLLTKGAGQIAQVAFKVGAGATSGAVSGAIAETGKVCKGEEVSLMSYTKSICAGALSGAIGGVSGHLSSSLSKIPSKELSKVATRIGTQAAAGAVTDAGIQYAQNGKIDLGRVGLTVVGQTMVAAASESGKFVGERTQAYADLQNTRRIEEAFPDDKAKQQEVAKQVEKANSVSGIVIEEQNIKAANFDELKDVLPKSDLRNVRPDLIKDADNLHMLHGDRKGQAAIDIPDPAKNGRGAERIILQEDPDLFQKTGKRFVFVGHTDKHDYANAANAPGDMKPVYNPLDAIKPEAFISANRVIEDEDDEIKQSRNKKRD